MNKFKGLMLLSLGIPLFALTGCNPDKQQSKTQYSISFYGQSGGTETYNYYINGYTPITNMFKFSKDDCLIYFIELKDELKKDKTLPNDIEVKFGDQVKVKETDYHYTFIGDTTSPKLASLVVKPAPESNISVKVEIN